jgi:nicotinate dehydrogenase subunit B
MKKDKYSTIDFGDTTSGFSVNRREFLKIFGGGILVLFVVGDTFILEGSRDNKVNIPSDFNAILRIGEDGRATCYTGKIEMGQGIITSLAQTLADELDISLESVDMVMGDTDLCPWDMGTFGSMTTRYFGPELREAAAEARAVLLELASEFLNVPINQLEIKSGVLFDNKNTKNSVTYAQLTKGKRIERYLNKKPTVKSFSEFNIIGIPTLRSDAKDKVTGKAKYAGDIRLPGMLYAKILRPPAHGATIKSVDTSEAEKIQDVQIIRDGDLFAVLHKYLDIAEEAIRKVKGQFETPVSDVDDKSIFNYLLSVAPTGEIVDSGGNLSEGTKFSKSKFENEYYNSYVAHAPIEPHTATANIEAGKLTVWASTQTPFRLKEEIAKDLELLPDNVRVITPFVGGGFGGKSSNQQGVEAARLAKLTDKPVQVAWSRAEEFFYDTFRPAAIVKITSGINNNTGKISLWDYSVYFAGQRGSEHFYNIPHHRTSVHGSGWRSSEGTHPFNTGAWRAPANNTNTFARESQIDIMASAAGIDPLEFRLNNLKDERMIKVLKAAAEKFGWTKSVAPSSQGFGIACGIDAGTYVAHMAEVEVDKTNGNVQVKRVVCAQDMGLSVNPQGAMLQIEGCITMGLSYALTEEIHFKGGRILDLNFDTYEITRFSQTPKIETVIIEANDAPPQGGGEPAIVCMGALIANAIFDATGTRLFQLPMTPERIREAIR